MRETDAVKHFRRWLAATVLLQATLCTIPGTQARGDFYRYVGDDGVEVFTNTPKSGAAVRVLREPKHKPEVNKAPKVARMAEPKVPREAEPQSEAKEPLLPVKGLVTSNVGWRHDPIDGGIRHHNGVDIAVPVGTKVRAIAAGKVVESGSHGGYGNLVTVAHPDGMTSMYGHNSELVVKVGDEVAAGDTVALSGSTGRSTGPHLHFELWKNGANVTQAYLKNGAGIPEVAGGIRSYLHSDGSIVFTNLR